MGPEARHPWAQYVPAWLAAVFSVSGYKKSAGTFGGLKCPKVTRFFSREVGLNLNPSPGGGSKLNPTPPVKTLVRIRRCSFDLHVFSKVHDSEMRIHRVYFAWPAHYRTSVWRFVFVLLAGICANSFAATQQT